MRWFAWNLVGFAVVALIMLRVVSPTQAYRSISWTTGVLVAGMIPLSTAMTTSGAAEQLADRIVDIVGSGSPYTLVFALCLLTAVLGQLISNTATALIVIPIALSAAAETGVSGKPLLMAVNVAAAASFLTPVATPVNLMVAGPAGYRFGDHWKLGLPLMALFLTVATFLVPVFWSFCWPPPPAAAAWPTAATSTHRTRSGRASSGWSSQGRRRLRCTA